MRGCHAGCAPCCRVHGRVCCAEIGGMPPQPCWQMCQRCHCFTDQPLANLVTGLPQWNDPSQAQLLGQVNSLLCTVCGWLPCSPDSRLVITPCLPPGACLPAFAQRLLLACCVLTAQQPFLPRCCGEHFDAPYTAYTPHKLVGPALCWPLHLHMLFAQATGCCQAAWQPHHQLCGPASALADYVKRACCRLLVSHVTHAHAAFRAL